MARPIEKNGFVIFPRSLMDEELYFAEQFTKFQAYWDMIALANHSPGFFFIRNNRVDIKRGQLGWGLEKLGERWRWSRGKVERFMQLLETEGKIVRQKTNVTTIITILLYDEMQKYNTANDTTDNTANDNTNDNTNSKANGHKQQ